MLTSSSPTSAAMAPWPVACGVTTQAVAAGEAHRLHDVLRGPGGEDGVGTDLDREVPGRDEGVVVGVAGDGDGAGRCGRAARRTGACVRCGR